MIPRRHAHIHPGEFADIARWMATPPLDEAGIVAAWEKEVARRADVPCAAAVASGRRGMFLILEHLQIGPGDEVIMPAYTLGALAPLIQRLGAVPVPADIELETFNMAPGAVGRRLSVRTKAILVLHAFGLPCAIAPILALAAARGIPVIEDCAHALGASVDGQPVGSFGYAGFYSLEATKPVNTFGGGLVVSRDHGLIEHIRRAVAKDTVDAGPFLHKLRAVRQERWLFATNMALPLLGLLAAPGLRTYVNRFYRRAQPVPPEHIRYLAVQARLGLEKIKSLDERIRHRDKMAALARSLLSSDIRLPRVDAGARSTWYFLVALLPCAAAPVRQRLLLRGIDAGIEEEIADDCAALLGFPDCPNTRDVYRRTIALPMFDGIAASVVERTVKTLNRLVLHSSREDA